MWHTVYELSDDERETLRREYIELCNARNVEFLRDEKGRIYVRFETGDGEERWYFESYLYRCGNCGALGDDTHYESWCDRCGMVATKILDTN